MTGLIGTTTTALVALTNNADWDLLVAAICALVVVGVPGGLAALMNARDRRHRQDPGAS